jgi:hypothetical protein
MKKVAFTMAAAAILTLFASCGSTPEPEETAPEAPVVEQTSEETENNEPEEIIAEETEPEDTGSDARDEILAQIEEARKAALEAGADKSASNIWSELDKVYNELKNSDGDISSSGADLAMRYQTLANYANAKNEKKKIDDNDFAHYAQKDYDEGSELLASVEEAFAAETFDSSVAEKADKAYGKFKNVTFAAYRQLALEERELAFAAKKDADSVKAGVSRRDEYKAAAELFKAGDQLYAIKNPEASYKNYKTAKEQFTSLYKDVSAKRAQAQQKLDEAKRAVEDSASFAEKADQETPILDTEEIEGIEEASAVLLEEDNYEAPEAAEIDIPEAIDDDGNAVEPESSDIQETVAEEE